MILVLSAAALAAALTLPRFRRTAALAPTVAAWEARLQKRGALAAAIVSVGVVWYTWGGLVPIPKVHDESSYLLQADIFASLRWKAPRPPIPEFFEQPHVLVEPAVASKYPPGHALLLSVGALAGFHALVPLGLAGVTAALLFALVQRLANPWTALLAWLTWLTAPIVLQVQPSYFSQVTTAALVLSSWWLLLDWRATHKRRALLLLALAIGWGAITRPLTMLAFAIPIGLVVLRDSARLGLWRDLSAAVAVGILVLAILPVWSWRTTGDWRVSPVEQYRRDYLPFDRLGFTLDTSPPRRLGSPVQKATYDYFMTARRQQPLAALPWTAAFRAVQLAIGLFQGVRLPLALFAIVGLFLGGAPLRFAAASALLLFVAYLPYAHWAQWTVYYLEIAPVAAALAAVGIAAVAHRLAPSGESARTGVALATLAVAAFAVPASTQWPAEHRLRNALERPFLDYLDRLPARRAIVLVRYSPRAAQHMAVVRNHADLASAPVWVVHDLGPRNEELLRLAPDRQAFIFEEDRLAGGR